VLQALRSLARTALPAVAAVAAGVLARRHRALAERHDVDRRLLSGLSQLGEGVVVHEGARVIDANGAFCELTGYTRAELLALPSVLDLVAPSDADLVRRRLRAVDEGLDQGVHRTLLRHRDGSDVPCEVATVQIERDGRPHRLSLVHDLRERLAWERTLTEHAEQLASADAESAADQARTELVAMLTHDVGQPLRAVRGYAELFRDRWDTAPEPARRRMVEGLTASVDRLGVLAAQLLTINRAGAADLQPEPRPVALAGAVAEARAAVADLLPEVGVEGLTGVVVLVDPGHLQQMLVNLVTNAAKYGRPPVVVAACEAGDGAIEVRVRDAGEGVPPAFVERLFERYTRAAGSDERAPGHGLGLFIVRRLAEANGGRVHYEPGDDGGSCFVLGLVAAPVAPDLTVHGHSTRA